MTATLRAARRPFGLALPTVLLMLAGVAAVTAVGIPMWFARPDVTLDAAARLLVKDIEETQQRALFLSRPLHIEFDAGGQGYRIVDALGEPEPAPVGEGPFARDYGRDAVFRGVRVEAAEFDGRRLLVVARTGEYSADGRVVLTYRGAERTVRVERSGQRVSIDPREPVPAAR